MDDTLVAEDAQTGALRSCSGARNIGCGNDMASHTFLSGLIYEFLIYGRAVKQ